MEKQHKILNAAEGILYNIYYKSLWNNKYNIEGILYFNSSSEKYVS